MTCESDDGQLVVDVTSTTTIMHIQCAIKTIDNQKVGRGAAFAASMLALLAKKGPTTPAAPTTLTANTTAATPDDLHLPPPMDVSIGATSNRIEVGNSSTGNIYQGH